MDKKEAVVPLTAVTVEKVLAVKKIIQENKRIIYQEIQYLQQIGCRHSRNFKQASLCE